MLAGLGDGQTHGDLGEAAVIIAELDLLAHGETSLVLLVQSVSVLGSGGVPLEAAGQLAGDPLGGLVSGIVAVGAVVGGQLMMTWPSTRLLMKSMPSAIWSAS